MPTRDYKPRTSSRRKKSSGRASGWRWMFAGLVLGAFIVGLAWLKLDAPVETPEWIGAAPDRPPQSAPKDSQAPDIPPYQPRYRFYDELGRKQVVVPEEQLERRDTPAAADPTARYLIQVGSFQHMDEADRMQAELALLGIETRITKASLGGGEQRYRVQTGPYLGRSELDAARAQLKKSGYRDLLVRIIK
jgi:cell division protein FtsN